MFLNRFRNVNTTNTGWHYYFRNEKIDFFKNIKISFSLKESQISQTIFFDIFKTKNFPEKIKNFQKVFFLSSSKNWGESIGGVLGAFWAR